MREKLSWINIDIARIALLMATGAVSIAYAAFFWISERKIVDTFTARSFLDGIKTIPFNTWRTLILVCAAVAVMVVDEMLRELFGEENLRVRVGTIMLDLVLSLYVIYILNFNFNELLFWIFVSILQYTANTKTWYLTVVASLAMFLVTTPEIVGIVIPCFRVKDFLTAYAPDHQNYLTILFNVANVLCLFMFLICCIGIIVRKQQRLDEINTLYGRLSEANEELVDTNARLEELVLENARMAEIRERNRIAREVHDTLGHTLTGLAVGIDACELLKDEPALLEEQLSVLAEAARQGIADVRKSVASLKPDAPDRKSVIQAIREMIDTTQRMTRTDIDFVNNVPPMILSEDEENAIYRTVQESITNAIQHGHATKVRITFDKEENRVRIVVRDNGIGCEHPEEGFGLRHMKERIAMLDGTVVYRSDTEGFIVDALIPVRWRVANQTLGDGEYVSHSEE